MIVFFTYMVVRLMTATFFTPRFEKLCPAQSPNRPFDRSFADKFVILKFFQCLPAWLFFFCSLGHSSSGHLSLFFLCFPSAPLPSSCRRIGAFLKTGFVQQSGLDAPRKFAIHLNHCHSDMIGSSHFSGVQASCQFRSFSNYFCSTP